MRTRTFLVASSCGTAFRRNLICVGSRSVLRCSLRTSRLQPCVCTLRMHAYAVFCCLADHAVKLCVDTGAANSPPISDPAVGQAFLFISFNTGSNNITYQLFADNITEVMAGHIHISPSVGANGSVSIPLYQAPYANLPGATTTGLLAASALTPAVFVGPYLEVLPNYANVPVSQVLSQYVQTGLAYAQVWSVPLCLCPIVPFSWYSRVQLAWGMCLLRCAKGG